MSLFRRNSRVVSILDGAIKLVHGLLYIGVKTRKDCHEQRFAVPHHDCSSGDFGRAELHGGGHHYRVAGLSQSRPIVSYLALAPVLWRAPILFSPAVFLFVAAGSAEDYALRIDELIP
jgi:hypothetical protein